MSHLRPLSSPEEPPPRYSRRPLPPYRHVPGLTPHPATHPEGHSYGQREPPPSRECRELPERWRACDEYLFGVDLFNRAFLWEAHEAWEVVWKGAGPESNPGQFAQGLILTAAGLLRRHLGTPAGSDRLWEKACQRFDGIQRRVSIGAQGLYMGIEVTGWRTMVERYLRRPGSAYPYLRLST